MPSVFPHAVSGPWDIFFKQERRGCGEKKPRRERTASAWMNKEYGYHYRDYSEGPDRGKYDYNHPWSGKHTIHPYTCLPVGAPGLCVISLTEQWEGPSDYIKRWNKRAAYKNRKRIRKRAKWAQVDKCDSSHRNKYYHRNNRAINARRAFRRKQWRAYKSERLSQRAVQESKKLYKLSPTMQKMKIWSKIKNRIKSKGGSTPMVPQRKRSY